MVFRVIFLLISILFTPTFAAVSRADQIRLQSASFRQQKASYPGKEHTLSSHPKVGLGTALEEALLEAQAEQVYEHPVTDFIERQLNSDYKSCGEALGDVVQWFLVLYGDWYGNKASNTLGYYLYTLITVKVPKWYLICNTSPSPS